MKIIELREITVPISSSARNAVISFSEMTVSLVALVSDVQVAGRQVVGIGHNSNGRYGQGGLLRDRFFPRIARAAAAEYTDPDSGILDPFRIREILLRNEKPGGHGDRSVAVGTIDMAAWDLVAKLEGKPLALLLAERFGDGSVPSSVPVYAAGGYYYDEVGGGNGALLEEMGRYLNAGYSTVKMKIGGAPLAVDRRRIEDVLAWLPPGTSLAVDANGRFSLDQALEYGRHLQELPLAWFEEPCEPLDYGTLRMIGECYPGPLATGENLMAATEVRNLMRYGGLRPRRDILQMDPALSYGLPEYLEMRSIAEQYGWESNRFCPHGGHRFNLHLAAGLGLWGLEAYPGMFAPFEGFGTGVEIANGHASVPTEIGIGIEAMPNLQPYLDQLLG